MTTPATPRHQQGPDAGLLGSYESPIPIRPATLGDAVASEWTKIRSVRATVWTLGVMVALMLTVGLGTALLLAADSGGGMPDEPVLALGFFGVLLGSICVITLGVLTIGSEYGTGMIRTTLTACPSRGRVLAAKAIVFAALAFAVTTVTAAVVAVLQTLILGGAPASADDWLRGTVGVGLYLAALGLLSLGVGAIVRHSAGAITIMIGVVLLPLVLALFMFADRLRDVQRFLIEYSIPNQIGALYGTTMTESGPSGWEPLLLMLVLAAAVLGGAVAILNRRDV
ncbi:ABC transporter permease subunit [Streptomyces griseus]|uniref:ABC transporter permease subunit n=1 Tax=Streptomyces TaxID=1883 RepID=UPI0004C7932E|nr:MULTISPECIES: ABC transporter permease subunit [Streptomyces]MYT77153.1 ABC transporter permease subunit [Streptomyces sp. SID8364]SBU89450.1 ABC-type transport system involved in multi-copper enzyme maturation, permease component [Streptomyces sp. MnatMP-M77]SCE43411.1 ABC-type transport system involved in multi-copper enzyme maturation, permease component [Streptomyces sp. OspMP-M43]